MPIHEEVKESVGNANYKIFGEYPATFLAEVLEDKRSLTKAMDEDMLRGRGRMNGALDSLVIRAAKDIAEPDFGEKTGLMGLAKGNVKQDTGVDLASQGHHLAQTMSQLNQTLPNLLAMMGTLVPALQQLLKGAQSSPPETGK